MSNQEEYKDYKSFDEDYDVDTLTNDKLIKDHEYDGIRELDNKLPPWWKWLFYICVVFGIVYLVRLWVFEADDLVQQKEYDKEMAAVANLPAAESVEFEMVFLTDAASLESGKAIYDASCAVCHLVDGGGLVGPNFTDDYWIHGNSIEEMFVIVTDGILEKGMTPFKDQLSKQKRLEVISYILTLRGTTPANPKAPEGDKLDWPY